MHKSCIALTLFLVFYFGGNAQTIHPPQPIPYLTSGTYSDHFTDVFSFTHNSSTLSSLQGISAGVYNERRFLLKELSFYSLALGFPTGSAGIGVQMDYFGFAGYNQSKIGLAYGMKLNKTVSVGLQFDYNLFHISGYGNSSAINFEAGICMHPGGKFTIGLQVFNPVGGKLKKGTDEKLASIYQTGIGYEASKQVLICIEIIKEEDRPVNVNLGLKYIFANCFFAGIGIETATASPYGGAGWHWKNFRVDIAAAYHLQLGFTPSLILVIEIKEKNQE